MKLWLIIYSIINYFEQQSMFSPWNSYITKKIIFQKKKNNNNNSISSVVVIFTTKFKNKISFGKLDAILSFFWLFCYYLVSYLTPSLSTGSDAPASVLPLTVQHLCVCDLWEALPGHWSPEASQSPSQEDRVYPQGAHVLKGCVSTHIRS